MSFEKYASFSLVFTPLLSSYFFPNTTTVLETVFLFVNCIIFSYHNKAKHIVWPKYYRLFFAYALFVPILGWFYYRDISTAISSYITIVLYTACFIQYIPLLNFEDIKRYYKYIVVIACAFFILQEIMFTLLGWRISAILPFLPIRYDYTTTSDFIQAQMIAPISQSLFLEPSHFAQYLLGYLAILLGDSCNKKQLINIPAIMLSLVLLLTWSGNAIVLTFILWISFFFFIKLKPVVKYVIILPVMIIFVVQAFGIVSSTEKGSKLLDRTEELDGEQDKISSGAMRIYRGFIVYSNMTLSQQVTGVGSGVTIDVIDNSPVNWMFYDSEYYLNNVQTLLIGYGLIGTVVFLFFLLFLGRSNNYIAKFFIILFIGLSFIESLWGSARMLLYLSIPFLVYKKYLIEKYEKSNACFRNSTGSDKYGTSC